MLRRRVGLNLDQGLYQSFYYYHHHHHHHHHHCYNHYFSLLLIFFFLWGGGGWRGVGKGVGAVLKPGLKLPTWDSHTCAHVVPLQSWPLGFRLWECLLLPTPFIQQSPYIATSFSIPHTLANETLSFFSTPQRPPNETRATLWPSSTRNLKKTALHLSTPTGALAS